MTIELKNLPPVNTTPTFDVAVCDKLRDAFHGIFLAHPEVKCLSATITWNGGLNDANVLHGVWLHNTGGPVQTADGIIGSLHQSLKMVEEQVSRGKELVQMLREQVQVLGTEVITRREQEKEEKKTT